MSTHHTEVSEARRIVRAGRALIWIGPIIAALGGLLYLLDMHRFVASVLIAGIALTLVGFACRFIEPVGYRRDGTRFDRTRPEA